MLEIVWSNPHEPIYSEEDAPGGDPNVVEGCWRRV